MKLRGKTLVIVVLTFFGMAGVLYVAVWVILSNSFRSLEEQVARQAITQVQNTIDRELRGLSDTTQTYAQQDATNSFLQNTSATNPSPYLNTGIFRLQRIDLAILVNNEGQPVSAESYDAQNDQVVPLSSEALASISAQTELIQQAPQAGLVQLRTGLLLVASQPVLPGQGQGPARGVLIFGRQISPAEVQYLGDLTQLKLRIYGMDDESMPTDFITAKSVVNTNHPSYTRALDNQRLAGYYLLSDLNDQPAAILRIEMPRQFYQLGALNQNFLWLALVLSGLFFGFLAWMLLQSFVLRPVTSLSAEVKEISTSQDFSRRLPVRSRDELGSLSDETNHLVELLQKHQTEWQRTQDLQRRITQVRTAAEISRLIGAIQEPQSLLHQVVDLIRERFNLYYVGVFLLDERGEYALLKAGTGEAGQKMLATGHKLAVGGDSMIGWSTANQQARIALDTGQEAVRFKNPWLPLTRSELALPILNGNEVLGALTVQSVDPEAFDQDDITALQGIADSLSTALHNAQLFTQLQDSLSEIQNLHHQYLAQTWSKLPQDQQLDFIFEDPNSPEPKDSVQLPLALRDTVIGNLTLETAAGQLNPEDEAFVAEITTQAALALENARLLEETQRRAEQERIISNLSAKVWSMNDIEAILSTALQELGSAMEASEGVIRLEVTVE